MGRCPMLDMKVLFTGSPILSEMVILSERPDVLSALRTIMAELEMMYDG